MAKEPDKKQPPPPVSKDGPIPPEHFEDDQRCTGESDKSPGSLYDEMQKRKPKE